MSTALVPRPRGWARLLLLFLLLELATCQTATYKLASTPTNFMGFYIGSTTVKTVACATTATWYSISGYAGCCPSTTCKVYTACNSGTVSRLDGVVSVCASSVPKCLSQTIYPSSGSSYAQSLMQYGCVAETYSHFTLYREIVPTQAPVTKTLTVDGATVTVGPSSTEPLPTTLQTSQPPANPGKGADPSQPTGTGTPAAGATDSGSSSSKAWVAGAVVGPLVAAAAGLLFLLFWLRKRRGEKKNAGDAASGATVPLQPEQQQQDAAVAGKHASMYAASPPPGYDAKQPEMSVSYQNVAGYPPQSPPQSPQQHGYYPSQSPPPQGYYPSQSPPPQGYYPPQSPPPPSVHELPLQSPATVHELGPGQIAPPVHELDPTQVTPAAHELGPGQIAPPVHEVDPTQVTPAAHELGPGQIPRQELAGS